MPPRARTTTKTSPRTAPKPSAPKSSGTFARLMAEAAKMRTNVEPYVIDDVEPPIVITPPDSVEEQIELAELFRFQGGFAIADARRVLQLVCGEAFPRVWELFRGEHISVLVALVQDITDHFGPIMTMPGADDFPGGSGASPS